MRPSAREARIIVLYGLAMGWMNFFFYLSLNRIPLGIAVALEFTGPLAVAMAASRRPVDFLWIALAVLGLLALLPLEHGAQPLSPVGGRVRPRGRRLLGVVHRLRSEGARRPWRADGRDRDPGRCHRAGPGGCWRCGVEGVLARNPAGRVRPWRCCPSALPYTLEIYAMRRVPARTFGVLMSLDPALAALSGLLFLRETLSATQWAAILSIMFASAGMCRDQSRTAIRASRLALSRDRAPLRPRGSSLW